MKQKHYFNNKQNTLSLYVYSFPTYKLILQTSSRFELDRSAGDGLGFLERL